MSLAFFISLFNAQHVSNVNTSILRSLRLICWVISWVVLLWYDVCWCYVVVWLVWCGIRMQAEALVSLFNAQHFRMLIHPSSGACELFFELSVLQAQACNKDTTPTQPHRNYNTHGSKNNTANVVIQQNNRKHLMMDILISDTCWAHKK